MQQPQEEEAHTEFKLDAAAFFDQQHPQHRAVVYNFNVPIRLVQDLATFQTIRTQVETDFPPGNTTDTVYHPSYQISAVYTLTNSNTGEERIWKGSFNPRGRDWSQITVFRLLDHGTFVNDARANCSHDHMLNRLSVRLEGKDSAWNLGEILAAIITVQATVRTTHPVFLRYPRLLYNHHGNEEGPRERRRRRRRGQRQGRGQDRAIRIYLG